MRSTVICLAACTALSCGGLARSSSDSAAGDPNAEQPEPGRAIVGRVLDKATGKPVRFANIRASIGESSAAADMTGADGSFRLDLAPGAYTVVVSAGTRYAHYEDIQVFEDKNTTLNFELPVPTASNAEPVTGSIEGRVIDKQSREPFPGAVVSASSPVVSDAQLAIAEEGGVYRFEQLPPGTYVVSVYYHLIGKGNVEVRRSGVKVRKGSSERVDLELDTSDGLREE